MVRQVCQYFFINFHPQILKCILINVRKNDQSEKRGRKVRRKEEGGQEGRERGREEKENETVTLRIMSLIIF